MKVPIFPLALNATVAGYMTARTTFKVLSFFGWMLTVLTYTIHCSHRRHYRHCQWCPEIHEELHVRSTLTGQFQQLDLVLDFPKTPGHCYYHKKDWYFPVPLHTGQSFPC